MNDLLQKKQNNSQVVAIFNICICKEEEQCITPQQPQLRFKTNSRKRTNQTGLTPHSP